MLKNTFALLVSLAMTIGVANGSETNLILDIAFERNIPVGAGINHLQSMNRKVQLDFNKPTPVSLENGWVLEVLANDEGTSADLTLTVLDSVKPGATVLATPHLLAPLGKVSTARWANDEEKLSISVTPLKSGSKL
jgi:hypothetical protein